MGGHDLDTLLDRFTAELRRMLPLVAVWAHGSLALGDFQPGHSDLDLIAVVESQVTGDQRRQLTRLHESLAAEFPAAVKLHCSYLPRTGLPELAARHPTWAHQEFLIRPVTPVSRRELHLGDLTLYGPPPTELLPPVPDAELTAFIRADLADFWLPATAWPLRWLQDIWVDLGALALARATVTLSDGRLITKGEALDVLPALGAPPALVSDIRARRYASPEDFPTPTDSTAPTAPTRPAPSPAPPSNARWRRTRAERPGAQGASADGGDVDRVGRRAVLQGVGELHDVGLGLVEDLGEGGGEGGAGRVVGPEGEDAAGVQVLGEAA